MIDQKRVRFLLLLKKTVEDQLVMIEIIEIKDDQVQEVMIVVEDDLFPEKIVINVIDVIKKTRDKKNKKSNVSLKLNDKSKKSLKSNEKKS